MAHIVRLTSTQLGVLCCLYPSIPMSQCLATKCEWLFRLCDSRFHNGTPGMPWGRGERGGFPLKSLVSNASVEQNWTCHVRYRQSSVCSHTASVYADRSEGGHVFGGQRASWGRGSCIPVEQPHLQWCGERHDAIRPSCSLFSSCPTATHRRGPKGKRFNAVETRFEDHAQGSRGLAAIRQ